MGLADELNDSKRTEDALLRHRAFLLRVAREVCGDAHAEDAVQEASLRALENPARHTDALKAWLATIVRHTSVELVRADARRRRREASVSRPEHVHPPRHDADGQLVHSRVLAAIDDLGEPYRSTLLLRIRDDLPVEAIASQTGVPIETARTRMKRGRAMLRESLDRHFGGRREWTIAIFAVLGAGRAATPPPTFVRRILGSRAAWLATGAAAIVGTWFALTASFDSAAAERDRVAEASAAPDRDGGLAGEPQRVGVMLESPSAAERSIVSRVRVRGQCVDAAGESVAGARVFALPADEPAVRHPFEPNALSATIADPFGRFELSVPRAPAFLVADTASAIVGEVAYLDADVGAEVELELVLEPARAVSGRAVDASGVPVAAADVELFVPSAYRHLERRAVAHGVSFVGDVSMRTTTDAAGRYAASIASSIDRAVSVRHPGHPDGRGGMREALSGADVRLDHSYSTQVQVDLAGVPLGGIRVELFPQNGDAPRVGMTDASGLCRFDDLPGWKSFVGRFTRADLTMYASLPRSFAQGEAWPAPMVRRHDRAGRLCDSDGVPIAGARLTIRDPGVAARTRSAGFAPHVASTVATLSETETDGDGRFVMPRAGNLFVEVAPPAERAPATLAVEPGKDEIVLRLPPSDGTNDVAAQVRAHDGGVLDAFRVRSLFLAGGDAHTGDWREFRDARGQLVWSEPAGRPFTLEIEAEGYGRARLTPTYKLAFDEELEVRLPRARDIEIAFVDARGRPLAAAPVRCLDEAGEPLFVRVHTNFATSRIALDRRGRARTPGLPAQHVSFSIAPPALHEPYEVSVDTRKVERAHTFTLPHNLGGPRVLRRIWIDGPVGKSRNLRVRSNDARGAILFDRKLRWHAGKLELVEPMRARYSIQEDGGLQSSFPDESWTEGPAPICGKLDAGRGYVDLPVPIGESARVTLTSAGFEREVVLESREDAEPPIITVPARAKRGEPAAQDE